MNLVPNRVVTFLDVDPLHSSALLTSRIDMRPGQQFRVTAARAIAEFPRSRLARLARRIPGLGRLFRDRDAVARARATAQVRIDHVGVGHFACAPEKCDELPVVHGNQDISVQIVNTGRAPIAVHVLVEGVLS